MNFDSENLLKNIKEKPNNRDYFKEDDFIN